MKWECSKKSTLVSTDLASRDRWSQALGAPISESWELHISSEIPRPWGAVLHGSAVDEGFRWSLVSGDFTAFSALVRANGDQVTAEVHWAWPLPVPMPLQREFERELQARFDRLTA